MNDVHAWLGKGELIRDNQKLKFPDNKWRQSNLKNLI
jgi:hypothetical protein